MIQSPILYGKKDFVYFYVFQISWKAVATDKLTNVATKNPVLVDAVNPDNSNNHGGAFGTNGNHVPAGGEVL